MLGGYPQGVWRVPTMCFGGSSQCDSGGLCSVFGDLLNVFSGVHAACFEDQLRVQGFQ